MAACCRLPAGREVLCIRALLHPMPAARSGGIDGLALTLHPSGTPSHPSGVQCSACCSELPPLPSETLADLQQEEAELNDDGAEEVSNRLTICKPLGGFAWGAAAAGVAA